MAYKKNVQRLDSTKYLQEDGSLNLVNNKINCSMNPTIDNTKKQQFAETVKLIRAVTTTVSISTITAGDQHLSDSNISDSADKIMENSLDANGIQMVCDSSVK
ncbi:unnamed protein product [Heterobilharzia americana]|nr:unnamed protein product [Heterobilharzia americana]